MTTTVTGLDPLLKALRECDRKVQGRVGRKAVTKGSSIVAKSAKSRVRTKSKRLKKSIGQKVVTYRTNGVTVGVIGPRTGFSEVVNGRNHDPTRYGHIVEKGRRAVLVKTKKVMSDGTVVYGVRVKAAKAQPFLRPAIDESASEVQSAMADIIKAGIGAT